MLARKFTFVVLVTLLALGGCGGDSSGSGSGPGGTDGGGGGTDAGGGTDGGGTIPNVPGGDEFYVANFLDVGREMDGIAPGFNLDGLVTNDTTSDPSECTPPQMDFTAPDGTPGVDNQFAILAGTLEQTLDVDLRMSINDNIATGSLLLLMEASDVGDFTNDGNVQVEILLGLLPEGASAMTGADGRLSAGQTFDVNQVSEGMAIVSGEIRNGVLRTQPTDIPLSIPFSADTTINLTVRDGILEGNISASGITNGVIGGELLVSELLAAITAIPDAAGFESLAQQLLENNADLGNPTMCDAISIGLVFEAVDAVRGVTRAAPVTNPDGGVGTDGGA